MFFYFPDYFFTKITNILIIFSIFQNISDFFLFTSVVIIYFLSISAIVFHLF